MGAQIDRSSGQAFYALTPERILSAVECGGRRSTGYSMSLNSLENRVYDVELADADGEAGEHVVAKFYRPGRWSERAILAEHQFLKELVEHEVPAVAPLPLDGSGATLRAVQTGDTHAMYFALFPKVRGRATEEPDDEKLEVLGRLLARLHNVGQIGDAVDRPRLDPASYGLHSLRILAEREIVPQAVVATHRDVSRALCDAIATPYERLAPTSADVRIHADCHHGNLLWDANGPFFLDFDDFTRGPAVQDLWMVVPGRDPESIARRGVLIDAYEEMRPFDSRTLALVEPLRALRILRYAGWIAERYDDPAFQRAFPDFLDESFWRREVTVLAELLQQITRPQPWAT